MAVTTSQQLTRYFHDFSETEVTFTRDVIRATRLHPAGVHLKCLGDQWPCVLYSASMTSAKIIANLDANLNETLRKASTSVSLRLCFNESDARQPIAFFVKAKTTGITPYGEERPTLYFANLTFSQRPPDDLILILGRLLEANDNATRRSEWRVPMTPAMVKKLGIIPNRAIVTIDAGPRRALLRDISFSGCKLVTAACDGDLLNRTVVVTFTFQDPEEEITIPATVRRSDPIEGQDALSVLGVQLDAEKVPGAYKLRINNAIRAERSEKDEE